MVCPWTYTSIPEAFRKLASQTELSHMLIRFSIALGQTKPLRESPNTSLGRTSKFKSLIDYIVLGLMYPAVREREYLEYAFNKEDVTASMYLVSAQSRLPGPKRDESQVFHFKRFSRKGAKHTFRTIGIVDTFIIKVDNTKFVLHCECIPYYHPSIETTGLAGMITYSAGQSHVAKRYSHSRRILAAQLEVMPSSVTLKIQLDALQRFRKALDDIKAPGPAAGISLISQAQQLEQLLLAKDFSHNTDHHLFDRLDPASSLVTELPTDQRTAFEHIKHINDLFAFVHAPAGTAENSFVLNMISILVSLGKKVLVVAPTDFWVNTIVTQIDEQSTIRCFSLEEEIFGCPNGHWSPLRSLPESGDATEVLHRKALRRSIRARLSTQSKTNTTLRFNRGARTEVSIKILESSKVLVTTCAVASASFLQQHFKADTVVIGQAAYTHEVQLFPMICGFLDCSKLFLFVVTKLKWRQSFFQWLKKMRTTYGGIHSQFN